MSQLSQTLERLIEIISVEKLVGLVEKNINVLPKTEISQPNISQSNIIVKDYGNDIAKIQEQLESINSNLVVLSETIKNVIIGNVANPVAKVEEEHIRLNIEEKVEICCLPTVEHIISEIDYTTDKEEEEEEEEDAESEEDVSDNKVEESDISNNEVKAKEVEEEEVEEEEESESESESEVGVESEEEEEVVEEEEVEEKVKQEEVEQEEVEQEEVEQEEVEQEEVEQEEEVFEIEIDDVTYYATHEENGILYAVDKDGDVGKQVGIIKDGEPIFS